VKGRESDKIELHMHDPLCMHYAMLDDEARKAWVVEKVADIRVECAGTWTRGMTLLDQRERGKRPFEQKAEGRDDDDMDEGEDTAGYEDTNDDEGGWWAGTGNRVDIVWASSREDGGNMKTVEEMAKIIWGL